MADIYDLINEALRSGGPAPEGVTFDPRSPQGLTIADPAQRDVYAARAGQRAGVIAGQQYMDDLAANKLRLLAPLLQQVHGLDPQLQGFLLDKLGFQGAPKVQDKQAMQLQNQLTMAGFKNELGQGQRDVQNEGMKQRLEISQAQLAALTQQRQAENQMHQQAQALNTESRRMPSTPFKEANAIMLEMAKAGATPEQLHQAASAMGYDVAGTRPTGGFLGVGQTQTPVLGIRHPSGAVPQFGTAPAPESTGGATQGEVVVEKGGQRFAISPNKLQAAIKRGYKLVQ